MKLKDCKDWAFIPASESGIYPRGTFGVNRFGREVDASSLRRSGSSLFSVLEALFYVLAFVVVGCVCYYAITQSVYFN